MDYRSCQTKVVIPGHHLKFLGSVLQAEIAQAVVAGGLTRSEVSELVQAVKARRPAPAPRPEPVTLDLGDGTIVVVRWKKANTTNAAQALQKALKLVQESERPDQAA